MPDPLCPECGGEMVLREGKFGKFYGCRSYPSCTGSMNVRVAEAESKVDAGTKAMRTKASQALEKFAQSRGWTNLQAKKWMRESMGLNYDETNVALFSSKQCELLLAYIKLENNPDSLTEMNLAMQRAKRRRNF